MHRRQAADSQFQLMAGNDLVPPGTHQVDLGIEKFLLGVEDIEDDPRPHQGFRLDALQGDLVGPDLFLEGPHPCPGGREGFPGPGPAASMALRLASWACWRRRDATSLAWRSLE